MAFKYLSEYDEDILNFIDENCGFDVFEDGSIYHNEYEVTGGIYKLIDYIIDKLKNDVTKNRESHGV